MAKQKLTHFDNFFNAHYMKAVTVKPNKIISNEVKNN